MLERNMYQKTIGKERGQKENQWKKIKDNILIDKVSLTHGSISI